MSDKDDLKCPECGNKKVEKESLSDKVEGFAGKLVGGGAAVALFNVAALPVLAGIVGLEILEGEDVTCASCGHEWTI